MKTFHALLIAALFTTAACKKKDEAAKTEPAKTDTTAKTTEPAPTPEPPKAEPAKTEPTPTEPAKAEPAAAPVDLADTGAKMNALTEKLVKASKDAGKDCAKLGAALKSLNDEVKAVLALEKEIEKDAAKKKEYEEKFEKPAEAKLKDFTAKVEKCKDNADVKAFIDEMP